MLSRRTHEKILILAKTYPSPSAKYVETSCVAGINSDGEMRRLFPVPFRLMEDGKKFAKWQWIDVDVYKAKDDHRAESFKPYRDSIKVGETLSPKKSWFQRRPWIERIPTTSDPDSMDSARIDHGVTLGLIKPRSIVSLEIVRAASPDWTDEERKKLTQAQMAGDLFSNEHDAQGDLATLRKMPYKFYYNYQCDGPNSEKCFKHKIVDWEASALYWRCFYDYGPNGWEEKFRLKLEDELSRKDLYFLMGTVHRFPDQWLIVSIIYPPKPTHVRNSHGSLF